MKRGIILCAIVLCFMLPLNCSAMQIYDNHILFQSEGQVLLTSGFTEEGIYYEVYGEIIDINPSARVSLQVERTVVYDGRVLPPASIYWQEEIGGLDFKGTLYIDSSFYSASTDKTTAIYIGTITN